MYAVDLSRNIYWEDAQTNDQHFGLLAFDCGEKESVCYVDGDTSEWTDKDMVIQYEDGSFISVKYDASDVYIFIKRTLIWKRTRCMFRWIRPLKQAVPVWKIVQQNLKDLQILY